MSSSTTTLTYLNLELAIDAAANGQYRVRVLRSPAGEAEVPLQFPWPLNHLPTWLSQVQTLVLSPPQFKREQQLQQWGEALFAALFNGEVAARLTASKAVARASNQGLRIQLRCEPPELLAVPWELLYDPQAAEFLCLSHWTPLVRYLPVPHPTQPLQITPPLRILAFSASPAGLPELDLAQEERTLRATLAPLQQQGLVELVWLQGQQWRDLQQALHSGPWHVIHYSGHALYDPAQQAGKLLLADEIGEPYELRAHELARLLEAQPSVRLVVLNACEGARGDEQQAFSSLAAALVRRGLPAVLAMQYAILDEAAKEFSRSFYTALAAGLPVDAATGEARKALSLRRAYAPEWLTPVLYLRGDGQLWQTEATAAQPVPAAEPRNNATVQIGGSVSGSNIVIGNNHPNMTTTPPATPTDSADGVWIEQQIGHLRFALRSLRAELNPAHLTVGELQLTLLQRELSRRADEPAPNLAAIRAIGDWLLTNVPALREPLARFFRSPAAKRALNRAGPHGETWLQQAFRE